MNWLTRALSSSIGKKFILGITGLLLCGFLVVHLTGNMLMYVGAGEYNRYAHALHEQVELLAIAEIGLLLLFLAHVFLAVVTRNENNGARQHEYAVKESKQAPPLLQFQPHNWMFVTGAVVLGFVILHLLDFRFGIRNPGPADEEPFDRAVRLLKDPITFGGYIVGVLVLGVHLSHGFASAFQSLGLNHPKYNKCIKFVGAAFAVVVAVGFASFPLWANLFQR